MQGEAGVLGLQPARGAGHERLMRASQFRSQAFEVFAVYAFGADTVAVEQGGVEAQQ